MDDNTSASKKITSQSVVLPLICLHNLQISGCVALLDVVEKSSIGQDTATTSSSASGVTDCLSDEEHCWEPWRVLLIGDHVRYPAVPHVLRNFHAGVIRTGELVTPYRDHPVNPTIDDPGSIAAAIELRSQHGGNLIGEARVESQDVRQTAKIQRAPVPTAPPQNAR